MEEQKSKYSEFLRPQEEMLEIGRQKSKLTIGVPKENSSQENRVVLVPDGVSLLTKHGHQVVIEAGAGISAHFTDHEYSESGGQIVYSPDEVYKSDLVLKVAPVTLNRTGIPETPANPHLSFADWDPERRIFSFAHAEKSNCTGI